MAVGSELTFPSTLSLSFSAASAFLVGLGLKRSVASLFMTSCKSKSKEEKRGQRRDVEGKLERRRGEKEKTNLVQLDDPRDHGGSLLVGVDDSLLLGSFIEDLGMTESCCSVLLGLREEKARERRVRSERGTRRKRKKRENSSPR